MDLLYFPGEGYRMVKRRMRVALYGYHEYNGNAEAICHEIINDCWNGRYFRTSNGHFSQFWTRDFGFCTKALIRLGYKREVYKTLKYAIEIFKRHRRITTAITPSNKPIDVYKYSPDSLPLLLNSIVLANATDLIDKKFFQEEIDKFFNIVVGADGLVRKGWFSSMKDNSMRVSSTYNNTMVCLLANLAKKTGLNLPMKTDFRRLLIKKLWTGKYFRDSLADDTISGDANTFPYWTNVITDKKMLKSSINAVRKEGLDRPFPIKYTKEEGKDIKPLLKLLVPNYEGNCIWMHMGPLFVEITARVDNKKAKVYLEIYKDIIEKNRNFLEVYNPDGSIYKTLLYHSDEGMLWACNYLWLKHENRCSN